MYQCQPLPQRYYSTETVGIRIGGGGGGCRNSVLGAIFWSEDVPLNLMTIFFVQWVGDQEKYVKAIFSLASKLSPAVIFVDEGAQANGLSIVLFCVLHSQLCLFL
jgi:AAA+ superfamily predicted ATPase